MMKWAASCTASGGAIYNHLCRKYLGHKFRHYDLVIPGIYLREINSYKKYYKKIFLSVGKNRNI